MDNWSSLRGRLGAAAAAGAGLLALFTAISVAVIAWQATVNSLVDDVALATFLAAEANDPVTSPLPKSGRDGFVLTFDNGGRVLDQTGPLSPELVEALVQDVWLLATDEEEVVSVTYPDSDEAAELSVSGLLCPAATACDTVVVGSHKEPIATYLVSHLALIVTPVLIVASLAGLWARWLVGRSLRPVERMRRELAQITETNLSGRVEVPRTGDELAELGETFNQTIVRLDSAVSANERFVGDAAHELRSPIAGVRAAVELEGSKNPGGILDDALSELDRAARLIDDLLVLARHGGPNVAAFGDVDLDDLVASEVRSASTRFPAMDVQSSIEPARVNGSSDGLRRVVSNLVENACHYGNNRVHVVVDSGVDGPRIEVHDDGPGIPAAEVGRIFERFARLDDSRARSTGGSGLGLAIASEIAGDHGAKIEVRESLLGGACFVVRFGPATSNGAGPIEV